MRKQPKPKNYVHLHWNAYSNKQKVMQVFDFLTFESIPVDQANAKQPKIQLKTILADAPDQVLNLPHKVQKFYPVILCNNPKTVIHGEFNDATGDCNYTVVHEKPQSIAKNTALAVFSLHPLSLTRKLTRLFGKPFSYTGTVVTDTKQSLRNIFKKPDYARDQAYLSTWTDATSDKLTKMYGYYAAFFFISPVIYLVLSWFMQFQPAFILFLPLWLLALMSLHRRYEAKYRQRTKLRHYFLKLFTFRGF